MSRLTLVSSLPQRSQTNTPIQRAHALLAHYPIHSMRGVSVRGDFERVGEGVGLCLQPDFHDFHRRYDEDCFRCSGAETRCRECINN